MQARIRVSSSRCRLHSFGKVASRVKEKSASLNDLGFVGGASRETRTSESGNKKGRVTAIGETRVGQGSDQSQGKEKNS